MKEYSLMNKDELIAECEKKDEELDRLRRFKSLLASAIIHHYDSCRETTRHRSNEDRFE